MSIKLKITLLFLFATLIPFSVIGFLVYLNFSHSIQEAVIQNLDSIATIQKNRILDLISINQEELKVATNNSLLNETVAFYNSTNNNQQLHTITTIISDIKSQNPEFEMVSILNTHGVIIASTKSNLINTNHAYDTFFLKGVKKNDTSFLFKTNDRQVHYYLTGPLSTNERIVGVIVIEKKADKLYNLFKDFTGLGKTGSWGLATHIANGDALIIVPGRMDTNPDSPLKSILSKKLTNAPINQALQGNESDFPNLTNYLGIPVLAATRYISQTDWGLAVTIDQSEAYAELISLTNQIVFFGALITLFVLFLQSFLSEIITRPLITLSKAAKRIRDERFSTEVSIHIESNDEIGNLSSVFNEMVSKLKNSYKELEEADKAKDEFLSIVAHQLRTPLGTTRWSLERMIAGKYGKLTEKSKKIIVNVFESNQRLIYLVNLLLDVSRINQGKIQDNPEEIDIVSIIKELVKQFKEDLHKRSLSITVSADKDVPALYLDPKLFRQVIENLLSNAIKYNKDKGTILIKILSEIDSVQIQVTDSGIGIPQKDQTKVFEKFYRAENAAVLGIDGTGLGLFVVKSYVSLWKGKIWITGDKGEGTSIFIQLPKSGTVI